jgi:cytochrome c5
MKKSTLMMLAMATMMAMGQTAAAGTLQAPTDAVTIDGKKPVQFQHKVHLGLGLECGACHHDATHQPLNAEAIGAKKAAADLRCVQCHNADFANDKLRQPKDIFHARCQGCHKAGVNDKKGPTKCTACHGAKDKAAAKAPTKKLEGC